MTEITFTGDALPLSAWRALARGADLALSPAVLSRVDEGAAIIAAIVKKGEAVYGINTGFGKLANVRIADRDLETLQRNLVLSHAAGVGDLVPSRIVRLMMALKLVSLGRGASGVRRETMKLLQGMLAGNVIPAIPAQGSVGASGDLAPLAHLTATMIGEGDAFYGGERMPAVYALGRAGLEPVVLGPKEGLALLNGTQFSTAHALAALFDIERVFQSALIAGALSTDAARGSDTPFDARIQTLRGHRGQIDVAAALRTLMEGSGIRASHRTIDDRIQDPYCLRCQPQVMGAALDVMRQAAVTLVIEANGVSDNPLVMTDTGDVISGGNFHA